MILGRLAIDICGVLVHTLSNDAKSFYEKLGFEPSPLDSMMLMITLEDLTPPPRGDWAMRMRFWCEITREYEKLVKLSLGDFLWCTNRLSARLSHQSPVAFPNHHALLSYLALMCAECSRLKSGLRIFKLRSQHPTGRSGSIASFVAAISAEVAPSRDQ